MRPPTRTTPPTEEPARCPCGSEWFTLDDDDAPVGGAVALTADGCVRAYAGVPSCIECGRPWSPGARHLRLIG